MTTLPPRRAPYFVAGGTLGPRIPSYVKRPSDDELFEHVMMGELCYVLTPRQMGKSSLVARTIVRLNSEHIDTANIDLQDSGGLDEDTFYLNILDELRRAFELDVVVEDWWDENGRLGASLRFRRFFIDHLLPQVSSRVVIFIDEIDTMLTMPFRDNFFAAIRALFNGRASDPDLERLTFVLLGVASPSELIKDPDRTPFNIGTKINLQEFDPSDAAPLLKGLKKQHPKQAKAILERIFHWTSGHPYLTQRLCLLITQKSDRDWSDETIDMLVRQTFLSDEARNEDNIKLIQSRIDGSYNKRSLVKLYKRVYSGKAVQEDKASVAQNQLLLSGLVFLKQGQLQVRNQIYRNVFNHQWIQRETEINWGVSIGIAGGVIALLAIAALLYNTVWLPNLQRNYELSFLQATSAGEQAEALAGLASMRPLPVIGDSSPYEQSVRELFFGVGNWEQQKAIYDHHRFRESPEKLIRMIKIVYTSMVDVDETEQSTAMLTHMADNLKNLEGEDVAVLQQEIDQWIQGRTSIARGDLENALEAYNNAITANPNNPATLFERARILTELGNVADFESSSPNYYSLALADLDRLVSLVLLQPEPEPSETLPTSVLTQSTLTQTPASTSVAGATESPTLSSSPISTTLTPKATFDNTATPASTDELPATILFPQSSSTPTPSPLLSQFNTRSQWLNFISNFLQSESGLKDHIVYSENLESVFPNLLENGLLGSPIVTLVNERECVESAIFDLVVKNDNGFEELVLQNQAINFPSNFQRLSLSLSWENQSLVCQNFLANSENVEITWSADNGEILATGRWEAVYQPVTTPNTDTLIVKIWFDNQPFLYSFLLNFESDRIHIIQSGETLDTIADFYNVLVDDIISANNIANQNQLNVGDQIIIPVSSSETSDAASETISVPTPTLFLTPQPASTPDSTGSPRPTSTPRTSPQETVAFFTPTPSQTPSPTVPSFGILLVEPKDETCVGSENAVFSWEATRSLNSIEGVNGEYFALNIWAEGSPVYSVSWIKNTRYEVENISDPIAVYTQLVNCSGENGCFWNVDLIVSNVQSGSGFLPESFTLVYSSPSRRFCTAVASPPVPATNTPEP
ncbi:MAG: AAA-like domain-containing protein [Anaerolineaceae bacterium]|nr:AAA-like domain-containing protein [Anaerolineaceae bacterium]